MSIKYDLFVHLLVFHARRRVLWNLAQTPWDRLLFSGKHLNYKSFKCVTAVRPFILNLNLYPLALRSWRFDPRLKWHNYDYKVVLQVTVASRMTLWRINKLSIIAMVILTTSFAIQANKAGGNGERTGGRKKSIFPDSPLIVMTTSVQKRLQDGKRLIVWSLLLIMPLAFCWLYHQGINAQWGVTVSFIDRF